MMSSESTTDTHPTKRERKPPHPALWPSIIATVLSGGLTGVGFSVVREKDIDRMEKRLDSVEGRASSAEMAVVELKADSRNQDRMLNEIKATVDGLSVKLDVIRDRLPR